jgi:hypothetical protein
MKRKKSYKPRATSVPMLVNRLVNETVETLNENAMLLAFRLGHAQPMHFDQLALMTNMMEIASQGKPSPMAELLSKRFRAMAESVKDRYDRTGKLGLSGLEITWMKEHLVAYDNYWKLQTTTFYNDCVAELNAFHAELKEKRAA